MRTDKPVLRAICIKHYAKATISPTDGKEIELPVETLCTLSKITADDN